MSFTPNLYMELAFEQGTDAWLAWRNGGIGASDAPSIMGENPWKSANYLMKEKLEPASPFRGNDAMRRGTALEPAARRRYEQLHSVDVEPACLQSTERPWQRASVDGLSDDKRRVVEIKCGVKAYDIAARTQTVPRYYVGQIQHILAVTGLPMLDFFCYLPERPPIRIPIPRDDAYIEHLTMREEEFWAEVVRRRLAASIPIRPAC